MRRRLLASLIATPLLACAGRSHWRQVRRMEVRCHRGMVDGSIHAGQLESEFLEIVGPVEARVLAEFRIFELGWSGYDGVRVVSKGGRLVLGLRWSDADAPRIFFDALSDAERSFLSEPPNLY